MDEIPAPRASKCGVQWIHVGHSKFTSTSTPTTTSVNHSEETAGGADQNTTQEGTHGKGPSFLPPPDAANIPPGKCESLPSVHDTQESGDTVFFPSVRKGGNEGRGINFARREAASQALDCSSCARTAVNYGATDSCTQSSILALQQNAPFTHSHVESCTRTLYRGSEHVSFLAHRIDVCVREWVIPSRPSGNLPHEAVHDNINNNNDNFNFNNNNNNNDNNRYEAEGSLRQPPNASFAKSFSLPLSRALTEDEIRTMVQEVETVVLENEEWSETLFCGENAGLRSAVEEELWERTDELMQCLDEGSLKGLNDAVFGAMLERGKKETSGEGQGKDEGDEYQGDLDDYESRVRAVIHHHLSALAHAAAFPDTGLPACSDASEACLGCFTTNNGEGENDNEDDGPTPHMCTIGPMQHGGPLTTTLSTGHDLCSEVTRRTTALKRDLCAMFERDPGLHAASTHRPHASTMRIDHMRIDHMKQRMCEVIDTHFAPVYRTQTPRLKRVEAAVDAHLKNTILPLLWRSHHLASTSAHAYVRHWKREERDDLLDLFPARVTRMGHAMLAHWSNNVLVALHLVVLTDVWAFAVVASCATWGCECDQPLLRYLAVSLSLSSTTSAIVRSLSTKTSFRHAFAFEAMMLVVSFFWILKGYSWASASTRCAITSPALFWTVWTTTSIQWHTIYMFTMLVFLFTVIQTLRSTFRCLQNPN